MTQSLARDERTVIMGTDDIRIRILGQTLTMSRRRWDELIEQMKDGELKSYIEKVLSV